MLDQELDAIDEGGTLPGETAFRLHDTFGFPVDVTAEILTERGYDLDRSGFDIAMEEQRLRSKDAYKGSDLAAEHGEYLTLLRGVDATEFLGYDT